MLTVAIGVVALLGLGAQLPFGFVLLTACMIGALAGSQFTSFVFIMVAKTDMACDLDLESNERELALNLLLIAYDMGVFAGSTFIIFVLVCLNADDDGSFPTQLPK